MSIAGLKRQLDRAFSTSGGDCPGKPTRFLVQRGSRAPYVTQQGRPCGLCGEVHSQTLHVRYDRDFFGNAHRFPADAWDAAHATDAELDELDRVISENDRT